MIAEKRIESLASFSSHSRALTSMGGEDYEMLDCGMKVMSKCKARRVEARQEKALLQYIE